MMEFALDKGPYSDDQTIYSMGGLGLWPQYC